MGERGWPEEIIFVRKYPGQVPWVLDSSRTSDYREICRYVPADQARDAADPQSELEEAAGWLESRAEDHRRQMRDDARAGESERAAVSQGRSEGFRGAADRLRTLAAPTTATHGEEGKETDMASSPNQMIEATDEKLRELAFQAGGAAISVAMRDHPDYVMPTERVTEAVNAVLESFGVGEEGSDD